MTYTYLVAPVNPVTEHVWPDVCVTVTTTRGEYGADGDGRLGERREEIIGLEVEPEDLPKWVDLEAREMATNRWREGR